MAALGDRQCSQSPSNQQSEDENEEEFKYIVDDKINVSFDDYFDDHDEPHLMMKYSLKRNRCLKTIVLTNTSMPSKLPLL